MTDLPNHVQHITEVTVSGMKTYIPHTYCPPLVTSLVVHKHFSVRSLPQRKVYYTVRVRTYLYKVNNLLIVIKFKVIVVVNGLFSLLVYQ